MPEFNSVFGTDKKKISEGVWWEPHPGMKFLVARYDNPNFKKVLAEKRKPYLKRIRSLEFSEEFAKIAVQLVKETIAETVLLDWSGVDEDKKPVKRSVGKVLEYFDAEPEFYEEITDFSKDIENYRLDIKEESEKN